MQTNKNAHSCRQGWINWKINHYLVPWRLQPAGFLIAESTGMTSWEHGVLAAIEPGLGLPFLGLQAGQLTGSGRLQVGPEGVCVGVPVRSCASDQARGVSKVLRCSAQLRAAADLSSSPFVWIGREKVQSLLRWAGPFFQIQAGRQQGCVRCCGGIASPTNRQCFCHYHSDSMTATNHLEWHSPLLTPLCARESSVIYKVLNYLSFKPSSFHIVRATISFQWG